MDIEIIRELALALGIGLLLGLQRERAQKKVGGIRTFPLISLFGTISAYLAIEFGGWVLASGFVALAAVIAFASHDALRRNSQEVGAGVTSQVAALLLYAIGAYIAVGNLAVALVVSGCVAVLLEYKGGMHAFARAVGADDMRAIMKFVFLSLVILPVLPNQDFGPYEVLNPFQIWLMVVLIVGIGLCGYVAYKLTNARTGTLLGGILGGAISSTATTVSFARMVRNAPQGAALAAVVIMIASTVSFARVLVEIGIVAPGAFREMAAPLCVMAIGSALIAAVVFIIAGRESAEMPEHRNPAQLKWALIFGALYALVLLGVAAAKDHFGSAGLYVVGVISGLTDMDAITLSTANLVEAGRLAPGNGWRMILTASMANFVFKFVCIVILGPRRLVWWTGVVFAAAVAVGALILVFWPY